MGGGGGGVVPMSDVNFDKYPSCLSWQDLNKIRGRMADRTCSIYLVAIIFTIKTCPFFLILFCTFLIIIICSRKQKGYRWDLKKINYNKVNSNFFLLVSKVCASLICSGGICPGGICPRRYMS